MAKPFDPQAAEETTPWTLWYSDLFDREMPAQKQLSGTGFLNGLVALWNYTLSEGIVEDGRGSFSHFTLSCSEVIWGLHGDFLIPVSSTTTNPVLAKLRVWYFSFFDSQKEWAYYSSKKILSRAEGDPARAERDQKVREYLTVLAKRQLKFIRQWDKVDNHYYRQRDDLDKLLAEIVPFERIEQLLEA